MTINSNAKGKRFERTVAEWFRENLGVKARRGQQFSGGPESPDVVVPGLPIHIEAKAVEAFNLYKALEQAKNDCGEKLPVVVHKKNNKPMVFIVEADRVLEFAQLMRMVG